MANGSMLSQQLLQYLVPQYDQAAKEYNSLTGTNTFDLIGNGRTGFEQCLSTVYDNTLRPIGQMIAEDWDAFLASSTARYTAYKNDGSLYNAANYFLGGIPDAVVSIGEGYKLRAAALQQNQDASSFLNWLTSGFSGQFEAVVSTPMSDPDYWRATRNIVGTGTAAILGYKGFSEWNISQNPHSTEWLIRYSEKMAGPPGKVPPGTFDEAFEYDLGIVNDKSGMEVVGKSPAEAANSEWFERGYSNPPYKPGTQTEIVITEKDIEFVRVYSYSENGASNKLGGWLMRKEDIEGLSLAEITDKYALPVEPTHICEVVVPKGFELQTGIANGIEGWGNGGGRQYDTRGVYLPESAFINERPLE